ncbi:MAG: amino acid adenylation domain-containing protein [Deltaproteobacteria bacterium]|nr:amino acid adenylation domain-containing protein [Deltaproteobacteria bacterium]
MSVEESENLASAIAVVGLAGRFPEAQDLGQFWSQLCAGTESLRFFDRQELQEAGVEGELLDHPSFVPAGFLLDGVDRFDASFFGYSPREAQLLDPQQRLFLECSWQAMENAGYDPERVPGPVGVFGGASLSTYLLRLAAHPTLAASLGAWEAGLANAPDFVATRVAYKLNLDGPAYTVATACSTSLVAVHLACQSLLSYESDMALAGGCSVRVPHRGGYLYEESGITSPDGHTRPFDAAGRGTVFGSGAGIVVLRRLEEALEDGDRILAVIRGSATNNDGAHKVGFTAPSLQKQSAVVAEALANAGVPAASIGYVEAHGTGTELGDPIEVAALTAAYRAETPESQFCALGSVKSNVGHLDAAAGAAGLIKTVLSLHHGQIPPSLNFETPNPEIDFAASPFFVNTELRPWERGEVPRRAGVSSFGFGGTNAHLVLEEAPPQPASGPSRGFQLLVLSAKTEAATSVAAERLASFVEGDAQEGESRPLADVAFTLQQGRQAFAYRRTVVVETRPADTRPADTRAAAVEALRASGRTTECQRQQAPVAFLLPGQGSQHLRMAHQLWQQEEVFRLALDRIADGFLPHLGLDLREILFAESGEEDRATEQLQNTALAQPALFAVEVALAELWGSWGIRPAALLGHSLGEVTAAYLAGVFSFEDGLALVAQRGRLMAQQPPGSMLGVALSEQALVPLLEEAAEGTAAGQVVELAAINGPEACSVSGPAESIAAFAAQLEGRGVENRPLHTSHAFHSVSMEGAAEAFRGHLEGMTLRPPEIPFLSNLTGTWITPEEATDPGYWSRQLRQPVRFAAGLGALSTSSAVVDEPILLEVGPGETLGKLAKRALGASAVVFSSLGHPRRGKPDQQAMLQALGGLWTAGVEVDWDRLWSGEQRRRVALPTYPFERQRYWIDLPTEVPPAVGTGDSATAQAVGPAAEAHARPAMATAWAVPEGSTEEGLATLFQHSLGIAEVGRHDDFFELGGDSLMATRLLSRVRDQLAAKISLEQLFEAPTVAGLAVLVEEAGRDEAEPIPRLDRSGDLPLSFPQQRLWFLHQLDPSSAAYNLPGCLRLQGSLSRAALGRALDALVQRHEALRTTFSAPGGKAQQQIAPHLEVSLPVIDLSALESEERSARGFELLRASASQPFDLAKGPLLRCLLLRLQGDDHFLLVTLHHVIADGWSWGVLSREVSTLYGAFAAGMPSPLEDLAVQYADFAAWQQERLGQGLPEQHAEYWRQRLTPPPAPLNLPRDRPRSARRRSQDRKLSGGTHHFEVPAALASSLEELCRSRGTTLFVVIMAAFQTLLARHCDQADIALGTPVANRSRPELEGLIGFFVNTLVVRSDLSGNPTFATLLERVAQGALEAQVHQDLPFERLVDELQPERQAGRNPFFQVAFALQNTPQEATAVADLEITPYTIETDTAVFDLTLSLFPGPKSHQASLQFDRDGFDETTIRRWCGQFLRLLTAIGESPQLRLRELPLLGAVDRHQLVVEWNATDTAYPRDAAIHHLFEEQARRRPDDAAVIDGDTTLTYGQLDQRANQVARALLRQGVGPGDLVGLLLERSSLLVEGILGTLKVGAAFLPLDPDYPAERLTFMMQDAEAAALLVGAGLEERLPPALAPDASGALSDQTEVLVLPQAARGESQGPLPCGAELSPNRGGDLAYVMYTSGSTGRPKGVMVPHRAVVRLVRSTNYLNLGPEDRLPQLAAAAFDAITLELWGALLNGGALVLVPRSVALSPPALEEMFHHHGVSAGFVTAALFGQVMDQAPAAFTGMRYTLAGGEAVNPQWARRALAQEPPVPLLNGYGPTESTTFAVVHQVSKLAPEAERVPIGRPISNTRSYVLDRRLRAVPLGTSGELCLGGDGLAQGYLRRPALTAEKFVPDDLSGRPGSRLYRTGDLVRQLSDGLLDCFGRLDRQVKVRGFRIELGEVESALEGLAPVQAAAVMVREDRPGDRRLVGYVVGMEEESLEAEELRGALIGQLPAFMVPATLVILEEMPLTANGKVDREALPAPDWQGDGGGEHQEPQTPQERALCEIWQAVLGVESVGVQDNFFALGGDSILSIQIVARAREAGLNLTPAALFENQTIAELAAVCGEAGASPESASRAPEAEVEELPDTFPLTPVQEGMLFHTLLHPGGGVYHEQMVCELRGALDVEAFETAWQQVIGRHEVLRTAFFWDGEETPFQRVAAQVEVGLEVIEGGDLEAFLEQDRRRDLNLTEPPLLRLTLLKESAEQSFFVWSFHHLILDGWSVGLVLKEVLDLYHGAEVSSLPLVSSYRGYVRWLGEQDLTAAETYWREALGDVSAATPLGLVRKGGEPEGADAEPPGGRSGERGLREIRLSKQMTSSLGEWARQHHLTLNTLIQGAWAWVLGHYSGEQDLVFGATVAGRPPGLAGVEEMVGLFINSLPLRVRLQPAAAPAPWLAELQQRFVALRQFEHTPLARVQSWSGVGQGEALFDSLVVFENVPMDDSLRRPGESPQVIDARFVQRANDALVILVEPASELLLRVGYEKDLIDDTAAHRLLAHLQRALVGLTGKGTRALRQISLMAPAERHQMLLEWNEATVEYPAGGCLQHIVEEQARRLPEVEAVVFEGQRMSYGELDRRANQLAHQLRSLGVGPETLVGLCLPRCRDLVVGVLGILKAGGAYVPLDPELPSRRLELIAGESRLGYLVTNEELVDRFRGLEEGTVCLDREDPDGESWPATAPANWSRPEHLAYVMHTSGSSGVPKGVMIPHGGVVNRLRFAPAAGHLRRGDRFLHKASLGFDVSVLEIFLPLLAGGAVVMARPGGQRDPSYLVQLMALEGVHQAIFPPSLLRLLVEEPDMGLCQQLHSIASSAEALPPLLQRRFFAKLKADLYNRYGPTEASIAATSWRCDRKVGSAVVPIGRPIARAHVHVLDRDLQPLAAGVTGRLYISGPGLARGYHRAPRRTAEAFLPNAFDGPLGGRLYDTGDLARFRSDGALEFLGRADHQVKVRGYRVELGEIEAALVALEEVREAVVMAREDAVGVHRLVAYAVPEAGGEIDAASLLEALGQRLPEFMVPSVVVPLDALPLNANGKVDRRALPQPELGRQAVANPFVAPQGPGQEAMAAVWREVLGVEKVGVDDDFFQLGGDSILSIRLASRARQEGFDLNLRQLFESRTVAKLVNLVGEPLPPGERPTAVGPGEANGDFPSLDYPDDQLSGAAGTEGEGQEDFSDLDPEDLDDILSQVALAGDDGGGWS